MQSARADTRHPAVLHIIRDKYQCYLNRPRIKQLRNFLTVLRKKHDEVLIAKGSPIGKGWRTNALPFDTALRKKKKFREVTEAKYRPEHKLLTTLTDQVRFDPQTSWSSHGKARRRVATNRYPACRQELWENFNALCRGESLRPASDFDANLTCVLLDYGDPYLRLAPFRMEVLWDMTY